MPTQPNRSMVAARVGLVVLGVALCSGISHAVAEIASPWNDHPNARSRLVAGEGRLLGVELQLAPGWKTYWRMPGDAGVPPSFEWAGSENIKSFDVLYPSPQSMQDQGGIAVGYKGTVIFPVRVIVDDPNKPATAILEFAFGVCREICIPVESKLKIELATAAQWPPLPALKAHLARVPHIAPDLTKAAPLITAIRRDNVAGRQKLFVTTNGASEVYVEAPDSLFVPLAQKKSSGLFELDLSASPDFKELIGKTLRITATTANGGVELAYPLK